MATDKSRIAFEDEIPAEVLRMRREGDPQVRLSLALDPSVTTALKAYAERHRITVTEAVRRAASLLDFFGEMVEEANGAELAIVRDDRIQKVRFDWDKKVS